MIRSTILGFILGCALGSGFVEAWHVVQSRNAEMVRVALAYCQRTQDSRCEQQPPK